MLAGPSFFALNVAQVVSLHLHGANLHHAYGDGYEPRGPFASDDPPNLVFIKIPKAASSTVGGVARRIAARHGLACVGDDSCDWTIEPGVNAHHELRQKLKLPSKKPTVWMTAIRDPLSRCMSEFYHFQASRENASDSAEAKLKFMRSNQCKNLHWLFMTQNEHANSQEVLAAFNATLLVERFEESLAITIRNLGLSLSDALYLTAKDSASFPVPHRDFNDEPIEVQNFGRSVEFKTQNNLDYELWNMVNDRINAQMQEEENKQVYEAYTQLLADARSKCHTRCTWNVYATPKGQHCEDCLWHDNGCGHSCFDNLTAIS